MREFCVILALVTLSLACTGCRSAEKNPSGRFGTASPVEDGQDNTRRASECDIWFRTLPERFNSAAAAGVKAVYQFKITEETGAVKIWTVAVENQHCTVEEGESRKPDTVLYATCSDWLLLSSRRLSGFWAFATRRLKVKGDKALARHLEKLFFDTGSPGGAQK